MGIKWAPPSAEELAAREAPKPDPKPVAKSKKTDATKGDS